MTTLIKYGLGMLGVALLGFSWSSLPGGGTLFLLRTPDHTHIKFNNKIEDKPDHNIMLYSNYYGGAGVGVGDLNGDELPDIYFAGNLVEDKLYFNQGDFVFKDVTKKAGIKQDGGWSSGVVFGDVNGDQLTDIYVTCELYDDLPELRRNKLYINLGGGKFSEEAKNYGVDNDQRTRHATFLDYDLDGDLDLFLCNQPPNPGDYSKFKKNELIRPEYRLCLYENENGKFSDVTERAGLNMTGFPNSVTASDLDGDGWTDLFVANDFWIEDWIFINNRDGSFRNELYQRAPHISFSSMGIDAGDIDNDGTLDLIVVDMAAEDNYRSKANMSGMNPKRFWKVVNDGGHYQYMFNTLHLNQGDGYFTDIAQLAGVAKTDWSWSPLIADFDNDGWKDLYITNGLMRDIRNNDASKVFPKYLEKKLFEYVSSNPNPPADIDVWDVVDIDKAMKLVPSEKLSNYIYRNMGDLTFSKKMQDWGLDQKSFSNGSAFADLDLDGDLDLVVNNINDFAFVYENRAVDRKINNYLRIKLVTDKAPIQQVGTKIWLKNKGDEQFYEMTTVRGMYSTSELIAHFGLGQQTLVDSVIVRWPDGKMQTIEQVPANQVLEVLYAHASDAAVIVKSTKSQSILREITTGLDLDYQHVENEFDDYAKQVLLPHKMSTLGPKLSKGDVNGDGLEDVFIGGASGSAGQLFLQQSGGAFKPHMQTTFDEHRLREDMGSTFFDIDGDQDLDLYVVSGGNEFRRESDQYQDRIYLNDGQGTFVHAPDRLPSMTGCGGQVAPCDFDGDGDLDLLVAGRHIPWSYPEPASSVLLVNDGGTLVDVTTSQAPELQQIGMVNDALWMDYDQDGLKDIVLAGEWMPITILKNMGDQFKRQQIPTLEQEKGWWFSLASADMDHDGDQDLIAGNLGLNYKYHATQDEPFEVYHYDFDSNGQKDVVLTYYNFGIQYPLRGRECSSQQIPSLKKQFQNYDIFASSNVAEIYGQDKLENALHLEATNFASTYFENQGNGNFTAHKLPVEAQFSSVNSILPINLDDDPYLDLIIAGNQFHVEVETPRADGGYGLVLLGMGQGRFKSLTKTESGFYVPLDVKSMLSIKVGREHAILVGSNGDRLHAFGLPTSDDQQ